MPEVSADVNAAIAWLSSNGLALAIVSIILFLIYRWARPAIHRVLVRVMHAQESALADDPARENEVDRRVTTIEDLLAKVLRFSVVAAFIVVLLGIFDLWSVLAGLGLVLAAITLAGQSIVLDYLMGILILLEGQYFKGDIVRVGLIEGTVEEVGLRRTLIRDPRGVLHSISNGLIRESSNLTRTYAAAMIHVEGIADRDVEATIELIDEVGRDLADDPAFANELLDTLGYTGTTKLSSAGATLRFSGRVRPESRMKVELEMRRRIAAGLAAKGIEPIRPVGMGAAPPDGR
jgi:small conductance mechanosensitive channel